MNNLKDTLSRHVSQKERIRNNVLSQVYKKQNWIYLKLSTALASFILILIGGILFFNNPTSYVSIDINPSIMISTNVFDKVVKIEALNDSASEVIKDLNLYGKNVTDAVNEIVDNATNLGYINEESEDNAILVTTYCDNEEKRNEMQEQIHNNLNQNLNSKGIKSLIIDTELTEEDAQKANEYGVSEAKILFVKKAIEQNPELKFEDLIYLPVREIAKYIDGYENTNGANGNGLYQNNNESKGNGSENKTNGNGKGNGSGNGKKNGITD